MSAPAEKKLVKNGSQSAAQANAPKSRSRSASQPNGEPNEQSGTTIGCKYCAWACPYGARELDEERKPACVLACPTGARLFGDVKDPVSEVSKAIAEYLLSGGGVTG